MYQITLYILAVLLFIENANLTPASNFNLIINGITCDIYSNGIKNASCEMLKLSNNRYAFTIAFEFSKSYQRDLDVYYYIHMKPLMRNTTLRFIDFKRNICDALRVAYDIPLVQDAIIQLRKVSNVPFQCPFKENFLYIIKNFTFSPTNFNSIMPFVHFTQGLDIYESNKIISSLKTTGSILPKTKKKKN